MKYFVVNVVLPANVNLHATDPEVSTAPPAKPPPPAPKKHIPSNSALLPSHPPAKPAPAVPPKKLNGIKGKSGAPPAKPPPPPPPRKKLSNATNRTSKSAVDAPIIMSLHKVMTQ